MVKLILLLVKLLNVIGNLQIVLLMHIKLWKVIKMLVKLL